MKEEHDGRKYIFKENEKLQNAKVLEGLLTSISDSCCLRDSVLCRFLFLRNIYESSISAVVPINMSLEGIFKYFRAERQIRNILLILERQTWNSFENKFTYHSSGYVNLERQWWIHLLFFLSAMFEARVEPSNCSNCLNNSNDKMPSRELRRK